MERSQKMAKTKQTPRKHAEYKYEFETHYLYDARMSLPSLARSHSKSEDGARRACMARVDFEQYNKAVIVHLPTNRILHIYRRNPLTGAIERKNHLWEKLANEELVDA
jgi:hypothetical protein